MNNLKVYTHQFFFPTQTNIKLEQIVAEAYIVPNCPCVIFRSLLMLGLNKPKKKLCPKLEKNVNIKPNIITFLFKLRLIMYVL